jgi:hypothetical protein
MAFNHSSLRRFEACSCKQASRGQTLISRAASWHTIISVSNYLIAKFCHPFIEVMQIPAAPLFFFTFFHASLRFFQFQTLSIKEWTFLFCSFLTNIQQIASMPKPFRQSA